ncbi:BTAD domain-containing putative transcriptional regulator [Nocardia sp. NPDC058705]|uniref:AfsR/SARP family transcriptional regulator n=1 Tax=Nocardia sp. NPDC058705 TaxID=3346609 RepID=UPI0036C30B1E
MHDEFAVPRPIGCRFGILGELRLLTPTAQPVAVRGRNVSAFLGVLLANPNTVISVDRLIDIIWNGNPPARAREGVHVQAGRVRETIETAGLARGDLTSENGGYRLEIDPESVDWVRFERAVRIGHNKFRAGSLDGAVTTLSHALSLWRGTPLAGISDSDEIQAFSTTMTELYLSARETRIECMTELGMDREIVCEATSLVREHPYREDLYRYLMIALYRCRRRTDALIVYRDLQTLLRTELGIDPDPMVTDVFQCILDQSPIPPGTRIGLPERQIYAV